jgi:hypothetical protein
LSFIHNQYGSLSSFLVVPAVPSVTVSSSLSPNSNDDGTKNKYERLLKYVTKYNYTAPWETFHRPSEECGVAPNYNEFFSQPATKRSRYDEDKIIYNKFFRNSNVTTTTKGTKGTYVELGAFDGATESNTRFFDVCLGWKGLLIEGNPITYPKTRLQRPQSHRISYAPSCSAEYELTNKTVEFHQVVWSNAGLEGSALAYKDSPKPTVPVPCGPLGPVLQDMFPKGETINFFSLDVEGAELMVLQTIDFHDPDTPQIDIFMVESYNSDCQAVCPKRDQVRTLLQDVGYKLYVDLIKASDVFVHPKSPYQL